MQSMRWTLTSVLSLSLAAGCAETERAEARPAAASAPVYAALEARIPEWLERYETPSVNVAAIEDGEIVWSGAFGRQSPDKPADADTLYDTASLGKPVTAEVFLRLASRGLVSLDEPMAAHWLDPDIADDPRASRLTPRHVLTHQTGFRNWRRMTDGVLRFEWEPGSQTGYSGEGMQYLVRFVEAKLGRAFEDLADEVLLSPAGMNDTSLVRRDWFEGRMAWPMFPDGQWREPTARDEPLGAGEVHTDARDYAKTVVSIMNNEAVSDDVRAERYAISRDQTERCREREANPAACPERMGFGLGWYVYDYGDETIVAHSGANNGARALAVFSLDEKSGLVAFANGANGDYVIYEIADALGVRPDFVENERPESAFGAE